jgi:hypothetical protein
MRNAMPAFSTMTALSAVSGGYSWNQFVGDVKGVGESFVQGLHDGAQEIKKLFS